MTEKERTAYTDFVRLLYRKLAPKKEVSVAVAGNPYGWQTGWHGSYDYKELHKYSHYLMIMSYDESFMEDLQDQLQVYPGLKSLLIMQLLRECINTRNVCYLV